jgi:hypothetical protein
MTFVQDFMREEMKDKILVPMDGGKDVQGFYLKPPQGGWVQSTMILFTKGGIVIMGDLCPGNDRRNSGVISTPGYGLDWFGKGKLSERYLCEKFLSSQVWQVEIAKKWLKEYIEEIRARERDGSFAHYDPEYKTAVEKCKELEECLKDGWTPSGESLAAATTKLDKLREAKVQGHEEILRDMEEGWITEVVTFHDRLADLKSIFDEMPGYDYDHTAAGWLAAIQQKFAELYQASLKTSVPA